MLFQINTEFKIWHKKLAKDSTKSKIFFKQWHIATLVDVDRPNCQFVVHI